MRDRYDDHHYWDSRIERALRHKAGFAWGTFFFGMLVGAILF